MKHAQHVNYHVPNAFLPYKDIYHFCCSKPRLWIRQSFLTSLLFLLRSFLLILHQSQPYNFPAMANSWQLTRMTNPKLIFGRWAVAFGFIYLVTLTRAHSPILILSFPLLLFFSFVFVLPFCFPLIISFSFSVTISCCFPYPFLLSFPSPFIYSFPFLSLPLSFFMLRYVTLPILSCPILSYHILIISRPILCYPILSYNPIISFSILSYPIVSCHPIVSCRIIYPILSYPVLRHPIQPCPIPLHPISPYSLLSSPSLI